MDLQIDSEGMNSFKTNDGVNIRYLDTIDRDPGAFKKDTLILVRQSFVLCSANYYAIRPLFRL
jgi:hypothetical protein